MMNRRRKLINGRQFVFLLVLFVFHVNSLADGAAYSDIKDLQVESDELIVKHHHDWNSEAGQSWRHEMMMGDQNPFKPENIYSTITVEEKSSKKLLFTRSVPALTYLWISPDSLYIVGLSNLKLDNPFQLVIFDRQGHLLLKQHITPAEACFSKLEYENFRKLHPEGIPFLEDFVATQGDRVWVDFSRMGAPRILGDVLWNELAKRRCSSHFSRNFGDSVSNSISWYRREILKSITMKLPNGKKRIYYDSTQPPQPADPELKLKYRKGRPVELLLLDPKGERFSVPIPVQK